MKFEGRVDRILEWVGDSAESVRNKKNVNIKKNVCLIGIKYKKSFEINK